MNSTYIFISPCFVTYCIWRCTNDFIFFNWQVCGGFLWTVLCYSLAMFGIHDNSSPGRHFNIPCDYFPFLSYVDWLSKLYRTICNSR